MGETRIFETNSESVEQIRLLHKMIHYFEALDNCNENTNMKNYNFNEHQKQML